MARTCITAAPVGKGRRRGGTNAKRSRALLRADRPPGRGAVDAVGQIKWSALIDYPSTKARASLRNAGKSSAVSSMTASD